jgi:hypothetical protein
MLQKGNSLSSCAHIFILEVDTDYGKNPQRTTNKQYTTVQNISPPLSNYIYNYENTPINLLEWEIINVPINTSFKRSSLKVGMGDFIYEYILKLQSFRCGNVVVSITCKSQILFLKKSELCECKE